MTFYQWLQTQTGRIDPIGDIARDITTDRELPQSPQATWTREEWLDYLRAAGAVEGAIRAFEEAWAAYRESETR